VNPISGPGRGAIHKPDALAAKDHNVDTLECLDYIWRERRERMAEKKPVSRKLKSPGEQPVDENDERAGKHVVLELEWRQGFRDSLENHRARFKPMDSLENELLEDAVALWWRMQRAQAMETEMLELELQQEPEEDAPMTRIARAMGGCWTRSAWRSCADMKRACGDSIWRRWRICGSCS